jgi:hypothetical protein
MPRIEAHAGTLDSAMTRMVMLPDTKTGPETSPLRHRGTCLLVTV